MTYQRIMVPVDGSEASDEAVLSAVELARRNNASIRFLFCLDELSLPAGPRYSPSVFQAARDDGSTVLSRARSRAERAGVPVETCLNESPGERLGHCVADRAREWHADLIVVGTHGRKGIARVLMGSGAESIIREAPVPVLVIRGADQMGCEREMRRQT
ncbi:MAG: universal stress protein [Ramlibacter sp.]|nr:universal stress protein [Ramlibacter sp.]